MRVTVRDAELGRLLIMGRNLGEVARITKRELGWRRIASNRWLTPDHDEVVYVSLPEHLDRYQDGCLVYLMPGASDRDDWYELQAELLVRRHLVREL